MSFEGWYQMICENGHYFSGDCYDIEPENAACQCGSKVKWWNLVDVTNGSWDDDGNRIDGYIELELDKEAETCICSKCQNKHVISEETYELPEEGHLIESQVRAS